MKIMKITYLTSPMFNLTFVSGDRGRRPPGRGLGQDGPGRRRDLAPRGGLPQRRAQGTDLRLHPERCPGGRHRLGARRSVPWKKRCRFLGLWMLDDGWKWMEMEPVNS